jgi:hypothetical protein
VTPAEDTRKAEDDVAYAEAELASLREELEAGEIVAKHEVLPARKKFVLLRDRPRREAAREAEGGPGQRQGHGRLAQEHGAKPMTWEEMKVFTKDQVANYTKDGSVDVQRLTKDVRKNFGLNAGEASRLVDSVVRAK